MSKYLKLILWIPVNDRCVAVVCQTNTTATKDITVKERHREHSAAKSQAA